MKRFTLCLFLPALLGGCVFMNVSLVPTVRPLEEHIIEGSGKAKILVMDVSGFISGKEKKDGLVEEKTSMVSRIKEELQRAGEDSDISGVVVKLDTPGGTVTASDIIYHEIKEFKEQKEVPVYASITGLGTSGGYYVASAADKIYAHPTAITGSIGVITMKFNVEGLMEKIGVSSVSVKSGDKKDIFSPFREDTPEEKKIVQSIIDRLFSRFVDVVAEGREGKLKRDKVLALSDGRPYTAGQALTSGLIDGVGYLEETIEDMKDALGVEEAKVVAYVRPGSYKNNIYSALPKGGGDINLINIGPEALSALRGVEFLYLWSP